MKQAVGPFRIKIESFECSKSHLCQIDGELENLYVEAQLMELGVELGLPTRTGYTSFRTHCRWSELLTFHHQSYCDLPLESEVRVSLVWLSGPGHHVRLGQTSLRLFSKKGRLKTGRKKLLLRLSPAVAPPPAGTTPVGPPGPTPAGPAAAAAAASAATPPGEAASTAGGTAAEEAVMQMERLEKLLQRYDRGDMERCPWLDRLTFRRIEQMNQEAGDRLGPPHLLVELERWDRPIVHGVAPYSLIPPGASGPIRDPEVGCDNPVEHKHRKLARSLHRALVDRQLKPDAQERRRIEGLLQAPWDWADLKGTKMTAEHRQLLWRYRFALTKERAALTKFLICVDWTDHQEAVQAVDLIAEWEKQVTIDAASALMLLSANFTHPRVRQAAVKCLSRADDQELLGYLLQLVQALRYEETGRAGDHLLSLLVQRASRNFEIANYLHWYLHCQQLVEAVDSRDPARLRPFERALRKLRTNLERAPSGRAMLSMLDRQHELVEMLSRLAVEVKTSRESRPRRLERLRQSLASKQAQALFSSPVDIAPAFPGRAGITAHTASASGGEEGPLGIRLCMNPHVVVTGLAADDSEIFKSAMLPLGVSFLAHVPQTEVHAADRLQYTYRVIFKHGDDMRQDQLVLQMVRLMDRELKQTGLDLKLTPYRVLATSPTTGLVERVDAQPLSRILAENNKDIQRYLRQHHPALAPFGIAPEVMDTFVKSCAGYCVVTYLMGIGDRHLDNVLLCPDGRLFHIDFGYILGRDPKPMPPPFKLVREMVDAMGGQQSSLYRQFQQFCSEAYVILRRRGELFINLMMLMKDANIPDISGVPGRPEDPERQLYKFWERFHLEMTNEEAYAHMQTLIVQSQNALVPQLVELAHKLKQDYFV